MRIAIGDDWSAAVTGDALRSLPRFDFRDFRVRLGPYANVEERGRFLQETFGSGPLLWDTPDELRFDPETRMLVGAEFQLASEAADPSDTARLPRVPLVRAGGLHADEVRDVRAEVTTELCRAPGDTTLTCLRDLDVLDAPLDARVGIAADLALLVQNGIMVGWSLSDPVRYLTTGFAAADPAPPSPATARLFSACMDLVTSEQLEAVRARDPDALAALRDLDHRLRDQKEDRPRTDALRALIGELAEDYG